ncbi:hypothetical protein [Bradyrhizobium japonicum]|uniref:hypothetical protein n=1 Tax=Bradyrhizobium japonicum TaxID=375 RepID=UPI000231CAB4|nr:hypothetical protein [Bradyrhizobium japonicum]BAL07731.1 hypothetical protein BJ6T_24530 [Bradyrhizobium japonicum USDA 6]
MRAGRAAEHAEAVTLLSAVDSDDASPANPGALCIGATAFAIFLADALVKGVKQAASIQQRHRRDGGVVRRFVPVVRDVATATATAAAATATASTTASSSTSTSTTAANAQLRMVGTDEGGAQIPGLRIAGVHARSI